MKNCRYTVILIGIQLFAILAFRSDSLGVDLDNYDWEYSYLQTFSFKEILLSLRPFSNAQMLAGAESGFVLLNWLFGFSGLSFHAFLVFHAAVCVSSVCYFVFKYSRIPWLSLAIVIALGMHNLMFCILRQSLAVSILYLSIPFIVQRKFLKFLGMVFLASQFHVVSWFFLPLFWLSNMTVNYKRVLAIFGASIFICVANSFIYNFFFSNVFAVFGKPYELGSGMTYNNMFVFMSLICIVIFFFYGKEMVFNKIETTLFWGALLSVPVQAFGFFIPIFSRAAIGIFLPMSSILISNMIAKEKKERVFFFSFMCFLLFFGYYLFVSSSSNLHIIPYRSIFE
ncbi:EpsG family protein [Fibrobacter sp.]|uniref:EpsG family protein n=1 Tax=Fibrobacter sp. TaxID=35828 RepID=UPI00386EFA7E